MLNFKVHFFIIFCAISPLFCITQLDQFATGLKNIVDANFDQKDFELYQKKYNFLFRRCPEDCKRLLYNMLRTPTGKSDDPINQSIEYFKTGDIKEDDDDTDAASFQMNLSEKLIELVAKKDGFYCLYRGSYKYFFSSDADGNPIMKGKRQGGYTAGEDLLGHKAINLSNLGRFEFSYESCVDSASSDCSKAKKELLEFKRRLTQHYKIHLMPKEDDILKATQILMRAVKNDKELGALISDFKIRADLKFSYKDKEKRLPMPMVAIYPAEGKDKVQKLLDKLLVMFKDFEGLDIVPRYNLKVNDLIFYAQSDADDKGPDEKGNTSQYLQYFDKNKNYALYKDDFEKVPHEPYELKF